MVLFWIRACLPVVQQTSEQTLCRPGYPGQVSKRTPFIQNLIKSLWYLSTSTVCAITWCTATGIRKGMSQTMVRI